MLVDINVINSISQNKIDKSIDSSSNTPKGDGYFSASSVIEDSETTSNLDAVHYLLFANYILSLAILYLLLAIAIVYIENKVVNNK